MDKGNQARRRWRGFSMRDGKVYPMPQIDPSSGRVEHENSDEQKDAILAKLIDHSR